ncbi:hypothetical protein [Microtetraspora malaysiensis]|uniref:hypothetical protein n=1 Tax=Microtetraspora malaysiensis TaxID=161358 RepID=UPI003D8E953C
MSPRWEPSENPTPISEPTYRRGVFTGEFLRRREEIMIEVCDKRYVAREIYNLIRPPAGSPRIAADQPEAA